MKLVKSADGQPIPARINLIRDGKTVGTTDGFGYTIAEIWWMDCAGLHSARESGQRNGVCSGFREWPEAEGRLNAGESLPHSTFAIFAKF